MGITAVLRHLSVTTDPEQHGFELHWFTYTRIFSTVNTTELHGLCLVESVDAEETRMLKPDCKLYLG